VQPILRWAAICSGVIILVDLAAALFSAGQSSDSNAVAMAQSFDLVVNLGLYFYCGYRVGGATRVVRSAAESGVLAGALVGIAAIVIGQAVPPPLDEPPPQPLAALALNVAMAGVLAILSGFFGARQPQTRR